MLRTTTAGVLLFILCAASGAAQTVDGTVFRDYDANGTRGSFEPGVAGVAIDVYDDAGSVVGSATTDADGTYSAALSVGAGTDIRVEIGGLPDYLRPGAFGADSGTTILFAQSGDTSIDVGVNNPAQYCLPGTRMAAPCYVNGDPLTTPGGSCPGGGAAAADMDAFVTFLDTIDSNNATGVAHVADADVIGSTWGLAWQRSSGSLFAAANVKRHVGLGPLPGGSGGSRTGVIYRLTGDFTTDDGPTVEPWFNLDDIAGIDTGAEPTSRGLDPCSTEPNYDPNAFDAAGKIGLGDIDMSDDDQTLWVTNLNDRTIYELSIGNPPTVPTAGDITAHAFGAAEPSCTGGTFRPWALKFHDGMLYAGGVCSGESGGTGGDLTAHILVHDPDGADGNFTEIFQMDLDYPRGKVSDEGTNEPLATWRPWIDEWSDINTPAPGAGPFGQTLYPQPMLVDLEFDIDGSILLGFLDRAGSQFGNENYQTTAPDTATHEGVVAGDLMRVCFDPDDTNGDLNPYVLEFESDCPGGGPPNLSTDQVPPQGPGGREYYWSDYYRLDNNPNDPDAGTHQEVVLGGLAHRFGSGEIGMSAFDPYDNFRAGGVQWMSNADGSRTHMVEVFGQDAGGQPATFGKSAGIGDVELLCGEAPLEIGNRVWCDTDGDGVQGADEVGVGGVDLVLNCGASDVTQTSAGDGSYIFTDADYGAANGGDNIPRNASCTISIDTVADAATLIGACGSTDRSMPSNGGGDANGDARDTDAVEAGGGIVATTFQTGVSGSNNHTYDFGFTPAEYDCGDAPDASYATLDSSVGPCHIVSGGGPYLGFCVDAETNGQPEAYAAGDDLGTGGTVYGSCTGGDDEDGVNFIVLPEPGMQATVQVIASAPCLLNAWYDFDLNGAFDEPGDRIFTDEVLSAGVNSLNFNTPPTAILGDTTSRWRCSTAGGDESTGVSADGEIEDHQHTTVPVELQDFSID